MAKPGYRVFISHAAKDSRLAKQVAAKIEAAGASVAFDARKVSAGDSIQQQIDEGLSASDEVLVLITPNSRQSPNVGFEIGVALGLGKKVVPVVDGLAAGDLPPALMRMKSINTEGVTRYIAEAGRRPEAATIASVPTTRSGSKPALIRPARPSPSGGAKPKASKARGR